MQRAKKEITLDDARAFPRNKKCRLAHVQGGILLFENNPEQGFLHLQLIAVIFNFDNSYAAFG